uniref:Uncharacterized protein n=1 Tax=Cucumis melo TaxID=3656 RepID=A0A9I9DJL0_CUCME
MELRSGGSPTIVLQNSKYIVNLTPKSSLFTRTVLPNLSWKSHPTSIGNKGETPTRLQNSKYIVIVLLRTMQLLNGLRKIRSIKINSNEGNAYYDNKLPRSASKKLPRQINVRRPDDKPSGQRTQYGRRRKMTSATTTKRRDHQTTFGKTFNGVTFDKTNRCSTKIGATTPRRNHDGNTTETRN